MSLRERQEVQEVSRRLEALTDAELVEFVPSVDLEVSARFYGEVLGLRPVEASEFANAYEVSGTQLRVTRVARRAAAAYTVAGFRVADILASIRALRGAGVEFLRHEGLEQDEQGVWLSPSGSRIAWFCDPDGNVLSLQQGPS